MSLTALIDYQSGNLHSAAKAFQRMAKETGHDGEIVVTSDADVIARADRLVLPGDGAFPACRSALLTSGGVFQAMREAVETHGRPFLGICVGMQLLATEGLEYVATPGLDWVPGRVRALAAGEGRKVPHMGWNNLVVDRDHPVMDGIATGDHAYFVHSYHLDLDATEDRLAHCEYGEPVTAIVARDTVVGTQFHPEKSQSAGLCLIANFLTWRP